MANVTNTITVNSASIQTLAALPGLNSPAISTPQNVAATLANGVLADQIDQKYTATLTFVASTPQNLDLTALLDVAGGTVNFAKVRSLMIVNRGLVGPLLVGGAAANTWTGFISSATATVSVGPSTATNKGVLLVTAPLLAGMAVSGSSRIFKLDPGPNAFSIDIEITGTSV